MANKVPAQHFTFFAVSRYLLHLKPDSLQTVPHSSRAGKRGKGGARGGTLHHGPEQTLVPHPRIFGWRKAVQEPGIHVCVKTRQGLDSIAYQQREHHPPLCELHSMPAASQRAILAKKLPSVVGQFGPQRQSATKVFWQDGMQLGADEMQPGRHRRCLRPQLPGAEEVESGAKSGFADDKMLSIFQFCPAGGKPVLLEKDMARLGDAGFAREVDVTILSGVWLAILPAEL